MSFRNQGRQERKDNLETVCSFNQLLLEYHTFANSNDSNASTLPNCSRELSWTEPVQVRVPELRLLSVQFSSVQSLIVSNSLQPHGLQHARPPYPSPTPGVDSNSCPLSWWCHPTISSSVVSFSSCFQSFPVSGSFPMSQCFPSGGQSIGVSASASVLPMNIQDWLPLRWTDWISLQSRGLSRVLSNTIVQKHQFFSTQLSLKFNSHVHTWLLEKP